MGAFFVYGVVSLDRTRTPGCDPGDLDSNSRLRTRFEEEICRSGGTVDALGLGPSVRKGVRVRISSPVPYIRLDSSVW